MDLRNPLTVDTDADAAIRATNTDAVNAKLSAIRLGYYADDYLPLFEERPGMDGLHSPVRRASPLMQRGTFARVHAVEGLVQRFLTAFDKSVQVVSLGAGSDTLGLRMLARRTKEGLRWIELDFWDIMMKKAKVVKEEKKLNGGLFEKVEVASGQGLMAWTKGNTGVYGVFGVDLRDLRATERVLFEEGGLDPLLPTCFLSECVLIYMEPTKSDAIVEMAAKKFTGPRMFIDFGQVEPHDAFGKQMVRNIALSRCPLLGIDEYPTVDDQRQRFERLGWNQARGISLFEYYEKYLPPEEARRIAKIEMLDELEEWTMLMKHYCLVWAVSSECAVQVLLDSGFRYG